MIKSRGDKNCSSFYCDSSVGCPKECTCKQNQCQNSSSSTGIDRRTYRSFDGSQWSNDGTDKQVFTGFQGGGQTPLNNQGQWSNNGLNNQVFVGADGDTHTMPDGTIMQGASHSEGYGSIFSKKNYWIGVVAGVVGLMAYQKYIK